MASLSMSPEQRQAIDAFRRDALEASFDSLVIVRFTAEWCGPCKQLAPLIDKVVAEAGQERTKQIVIDVDRDPIIASQFQIQSVPAVFLILGGKPVDGFVGVRSEREIRAMLEKWLAQLPPTPGEANLDSLVAAANALLEQGDAQEAAEAFAVIVRDAPERADAIAGYARALLALGQVDAAEAALAAVPEAATDPALTQARAALELARQATPDTELVAFHDRIAADPLDHEARLALANALFVRGDRDGAAEQLLASIQADPEWNGKAARAQLLKFIEAIGFGDPWSANMRRRLSAILFT